MTGLYIHIPFCEKKCAYCDFNSYEGIMRLEGAYVKRLIDELFSYPSDELCSVYLGGGTPSVFSPRSIGDILGAASKHFKILDGAEITIEANPSSLSPEKLSAYKNLGINRLSLGTQSFDDGELSRLGRLHTAGAAAAAFRAARGAGFENISIDLMFAVPGQTEKTWEKSLAAATALRPEHISMYSLTLEEGTPLYGRHNVSEETERALYWQGIDKLVQNGYRHYEISNLAIPGYESRHNSRYWKGLSYIGAGAGAHSYYKKTRYHNLPGVSDYISSAAPARGHEKITAAEAGRERYMLGLRLLEGIEDFQDERAKPLLENGLLERAGGRLRLTRRGLDVADYVIRELIE